MKICLLAGALALVLSASGALAQSSVPQVKDRFGRLVDGGAPLSIALAVSRHQQHGCADHDDRSPGERELP